MVGGWGCKTRKMTLEKNISCCFFQDLNSRPFNHESITLPAHRPCSHLSCAYCRILDKPSRLTALLSACDSPWQLTFFISAWLDLGLWLVLVDALPQTAQSTHASYWHPIWCKQKNCSLIPLLRTTSGNAFCSMEFERHCVFSKLWDWYTMGAQK